MPIVSNLAWTQRSSSPLSWGKVDSFDGYCVSRAPYRFSAPATLRTPFRSLNGKSYAVPLSMAMEFDALLRRASRKTTTPVDGRALIAAPGVLWRHDPYSTKVLHADPPRCPPGDTAAHSNHTTNSSNNNSSNTNSSNNANNSSNTNNSSHNATNLSSHSSHNGHSSHSGMGIGSRNGRGSAPASPPLLPSARPRPAPGVCRRVVIPPPPPAADRPKSLAMVRALPPLFGDLAEHLSPRPVCLGKSGTGTEAHGEDVQFVYMIGHRCRRTVCAAPSLYAVGELVVFEGDMGIEMGVVQTVISLEEFDTMDSEDLAAFGFPIDTDDIRAAIVLRVATVAERAHRKVLRELETDLLSFLQDGLDPKMFNHCHVEHMEFLDCEFQADCKKIYVYYQAKQHVLFRELAQYLHSLYRCRIWLHEVGRGSPAVSNDSSRGADISADKEFE